MDKFNGRVDSSVTGEFGFSALTLAPLIPVCPHMQDKKGPKNKRTQTHIIGMHNKMNGDRSQGFKHTSWLHQCFLQTLLLQHYT